MPFDSYSLKEQAKQIIKDADAKGTLAHGFFAIRGRSVLTGRLLKRMTPGCAVGHLAVAAKKAGLAAATSEVRSHDGGYNAYGLVKDGFGLDHHEVRAIERAFEETRDTSDGARETLRVIDSIPVRGD